MLLQVLVMAVPFGVVRVQLVVYVPDTLCAVSKLEPVTGRTHARCDAEV